MVHTKPDASTLHLWRVTDTVTLDTRNVVAACGEVHIHPGEVDELRPASEVNLDGHEWRGLDEWLQHHDVCDQCEDVVRHELDLDPRPVLAVDGVGYGKAGILNEAGYDTRWDLRGASQHELSELEGIGNALAARIKANVGEH